MRKALRRTAAVVISLILLSALLTPAPAALADNPDEITILYYESLGLSPTAFDTAQLPTGAQVAPMYFDAFGQRFTLEPSADPTINHAEQQYMRGRLAGLPGSWFSLARNGEEISGIVFDGRETYLIDALHRVAEYLTALPPADAPPNTIFRLEDLLLPEGLLSCSTETGAAANGQQAFNHLASELLASGVELTSMPNLPLRVGVIADKSLFNILGAATGTQITTIFDHVGTIINGELGLELVVEDVQIAETDQQDPFTDTLDASDLLQETGAWRADNQSDLGHTHFLTGRNIVNDSGNRLAGISYLGEPGRSGGICHPIYGASLSKYTSLSPLMSLIVTHELGHNLGAPHDSTFDGACPDTTGDTFIMAPKISNQTSPNFSACSIENIDAFLAQAACLYGTPEPVPPPASGNGVIDPGDDNPTGGDGSGNGGDGGTSGGGGGSLSPHLLLVLLLTVPGLRRRRTR